MLKFLNTCAEIEETVGAIYRQLAGSLPEEHELRGIWLKMAGDEDGHAQQIRLASRLPAREVFKGVNVSLGKVETLLQSARGVQKELQGARLAIGEALKLSMGIEEGFRQVHVALAVEFIDESMRRMFQSLAGDDERHANLLRHYLAKVTASPSEGANR
jgi:rubrerythrin